MTFDEFYAKYNGKGVDYDGVYGVQCFDLVNQYVVEVCGGKPFIGKGAYEIFTNFDNQPRIDLYSKIPNWPDFVPAKGDIVVWDAGLNNTVGHCAIANGKGDTTWFESFEQNWTGNNDPATIVRHDYNHVLGVLRPLVSKNSKTESGNKTLKGIDISRYQLYPDFEKVKKDVDFVIAQIGFGRYSSQVDSSFEWNYNQCKKYGIPIGGYWFSYASSPDDAVQEAKACLELIKGKQFEFPIYFDIEGSACSGNVSGKCKAFCETLENAGWFAGVYISRSPAQTYLDDFIKKNYSLWLAEYGSQLNWSGNVGMWQYTSGGSVRGIDGNVDMNECYVDYPTIIKAGGFNGYTNDPPTEVMDEVGFRKGYKELGVLAYKQLLILARKKGIIKQSVKNDQGFGEGTEIATNQFLASINKIQNGVAGKNTIAALGEKLKEVM